LPFLPCLTGIILAHPFHHRRLWPRGPRKESVGACSVTVLGEAFHPLTGSNRSLPSTAVRESVGFAGRITGQHFVIQGLGGVEGRHLKLGQHRG
jgi:hypothetical protein